MARTKLNEAYKKYSVEVTREKQREVEIVKGNLDLAAREEKLDVQVEIQKDNTFSKMKKYGHLYTKSMVTCTQNKAYAGKIDGATEEDRVTDRTSSKTSWVNHLWSRRG